MTLDNGLLKTGVLAASLTVLFSLFVYGIDRWDGADTVKIVPHIAVGSYDAGVTRYSTAIQIVNPGNGPVVLSASFFNEDGAPAEVTLSSTDPSTPLFAGHVTNLNIPGNGVIAITADTAPMYAVLWGAITTSAPVLISTVFEHRLVSTGELLGRVGVSASDSDMQLFNIPAVRSAGTRFDTGFAIVNTGVAVASLTATLRDASGTVLQTRTREFAAHEHISLFARDYFSLTDEPLETSYHSITFNSSSPQFAAIALGIEGANITSFPVNRIQ